MVFTLPVEGEVIVSQLTHTQYVIGEYIDQGSFGYVYGCTDDWLDDLAAKVLKPGAASLEQIEQRALSELRALVHVRHKNIIGVRDAFVYKGACYLITERCEFSLTNVLTHPTFDPTLWFEQFARCILQAVHFTHVQNVAHCDIHPGNVFVQFVFDERDATKSLTTFKLGDFGLARAFNAVNANSTFLETIRPPEVLNSQEFGVPGISVDIYHTGLVLLQFLKRQIITFSQDDILRGAPREMALTLDQPYRDVVANMLCRHLYARTPTALAAWRQFQSASRQARP